MQVDIVKTLIQYTVTNIRFYRLMTVLILSTFNFFLNKWAFILLLKLNDISYPKKNIQCYYEIKLILQISQDIFIILRNIITK